MGKAVKKWEKVYGKLLNLALLGEPGSPLGHTIKEYADIFQVSHPTVEKAVRLLRKEGYLLVKKCSGIFIHPSRPVEKDHAILLHVHPQTEPEVLDGPYALSRNTIFSYSKEKRIRVIDIQVDLFDEYTEIYKNVNIIGAVLNCFISDSYAVQIGEKLKKLRIRPCMIDAVKEGFDSIIQDNYKTGWQAGKVLDNIPGHGRVLIVGQPSFSDALFQREEGLNDYLYSSPRRPKIYWMRTMQVPIHFGSIVQSYINGGLRFDRAFVHSLALAEKLRSICAQNGLDVTILTLGDREMLTNANLPGIQLPFEEMAKRAVDLLLDKLDVPLNETSVEKLTGSVHFP